MDTTAMSKDLRAIVRRRPKKIAVVGTAASANLAPYNVPGWEIWCMATSKGSLPKWDRMFEIHPWDMVKAREPTTALYVMAISDGHPIYMRRREPEVPASVAFPIARIRARFPAIALQCQMALMFALAIDMQPDEMGLWGIHSQADEEYAYQRPGLLMLKWIAESRGIKVHIATESNLNIPVPIYGFDDPLPVAKVASKRHKWLKEQHVRVQGQLRTLQLQERELAGQVGNSEYVLRTYFPDMPGSFFSLNEI